jgi:hypothetical protein
MTPTLWLVGALCALCALFAVIEFALWLRDRRERVRRLFETPPFRTADGALIERQTRALREHGLNVTARPTYARPERQP